MLPKKQVSFTRKRQIIKPNASKLKLTLKRSKGKSKKTPKCLKGNLKMNMRNISVRRSERIKLFNTTLRHGKIRSKRSTSQSLTLEEKGTSRLIFTGPKKKLSEVIKKAPKEESKSSLSSRRTKEFEISSTQIRKGKEAIRAQNRSRSIGKVPFQSQPKKRMVGLSNRSKSKSAFKSLERSRRKEIKRVDKSDSVSVNKEPTNKRRKYLRSIYIAGKKLSHTPIQNIKQRARGQLINENKSIFVDIHEEAKIKKESPIRSQVTNPVIVDEVIPSQAELNHQKYELGNIIEMKQKSSSPQEKPSKDQFNADVDQNGISLDLFNTIQQTDEEKRQISTKKEGKRKKSSAQYGYKLQTHPNMNVHHLVDLKELASKPILTNTDLLLTILEIAQNREYYQISYSSSSRNFWNDIVNYTELKCIFSDYKPETLRKYWILLSKYEVEKIAEIINNNKTFLDDVPVKLLTLVTSISELLQGKITDLKDYIQQMKVYSRKQEIVQHEIIDSKSGEVTIIKDIATTTKSRKRYQPGYIRKFPAEQTKRGETAEENLDYEHVIQKLSEEDKNKFEQMKEFTEDGQKKLMSITEDDKFLFKIIDNVVEGLMKEFGQYSKDYVYDVLMGNSMNIFNTYKVLQSPEMYHDLVFTKADDQVIRQMKGKDEYNMLIKAKGMQRVIEREDFLNE